MASRRAHLLCVLKRHHTYGVNTFVCSYSLKPNPSHSLVLSSLLDWQPYLLCGFAGFRGSSRETRSRSWAAWPFFHSPLYDSSFIPLEKKSLKISYSLNSNPSHFLVLSSLLDWQPYLLCGFPGFVTLLERRVRAPRKRFEPRTIFYQTLTQMRPRVPCYFLGPIEDKANSSRFGSSLPSHFLLFFLFYFFFFFFFFFFFAYNPSVMRMRLRHQRQHWNRFRSCFSSSRVYLFSRSMLWVARGVNLLSLSLSLSFSLSLFFSQFSLFFLFLRRRK